MFSLFCSPAAFAFIFFLWCVQSFSSSLLNIISFIYDHLYSIQSSFLFVFLFFFSSLLLLLLLLDLVNTTNFYTFFLSCYFIIYCPIISITGKKLITNGVNDYSFFQMIITLAGWWEPVDCVSVYCSSGSTIHRSVDAAVMDDGVDCLGAPESQESEEAASIIRRHCWVQWVMDLSQLYFTKTACESSDPGDLLNRASL